jgi:hypothetical protein
MQVIQQQKARTDNALVNSVLSKTGVALDEVVFNAEGVKGADALADTTGEREEERSISEISQEQVDAIITEQRGNAVTQDQLDAIDKHLPMMASRAMLTVHRHEADQNTLVEKTSYDAAKAQKTNEIVRLATNGPLDSAAMLSAEADLEEMVVDYNHAHGIKDKTVIGQEIVVARSNAFMQGLIRGADEGFVSWANAAFDDLKDDDNKDEWGPALTEADEATLERSLGRITDAAETRSFIGKQVEEQAWDLNAPVSGKQRAQGAAAIREEFPPGENPEKTNLALEAWANRVNEHDANVRADKADAREATMTGYIEKGVPPSKVPQGLWDRLDEDGRKSARAYHAKLLADAAGKPGPQYTDRDVRDRVERYDDKEFADYVSGVGVDGATLKGDSGRISDQDYEEWTDRDKKQRDSITPIGTLNTEVKKRLELNFPVADHPQVSVATVEAWTMRLVADIAQAEKDRGKGRFTIEEIYEQVDKASGHWLENEGWLAKDKKRYHLQYRTGVPDPAGADVTDFYQTYENIPPHHRRVVADSLDIDSSKPLSGDDKDRIEEKYAQDYLYPLSKANEDERLSFLIGDIRGAETELIGEVLTSQQDAVQALDTETFYNAMSSQDVAWAEDIVRGEQQPLTQENVVEWFKRGTLIEDLDEFRRREGNVTSRYTDPQVVYWSAVERGWGPEAEALSGWSPESSVLEDRTGPRQ